jgi:transposase
LNELKARLQGLELAHAPLFSAPLPPNMAAALAVMDGRLPFEPKTAAEVLICEAIRRLVPLVTVHTQSARKGELVFDLHLRMERGFIDGPEETAPDEDTEIVPCQVLSSSRYRSSVAAQQRHEELAASGIYALTDEQWDLVKDHLPKTLCSRVAGWDVTTRVAADAIIFKLRCGNPFRYPPHHLGARKLLINAMFRLIYAGGVEVLIEKLGAHDPTWLEGLDVASLAEFRRPKNTKFTLVNTSALKAAGNGMSSGAYRLADEEWEAIQPCIDPILSRPTRRREGMDPRVAIEAILLKLKSRCAWPKIVVPGHTPETFKSWAKRAAWLGSWDRVVATLQSKFPDVLKGADLSGMDLWPRGPRASR